jgi:hypothetical protein
MAYEAYEYKLGHSKHNKVAIVEKPDGAAQLATRREHEEQNSKTEPTEFLGASTVHPACVPAPVARCFCAVDARYD